MSTAATSGRENSGGGAMPPFSMSLTCVPDSAMRSSGVWGQVLMLPISSHFLQKKV
jgi:hypothetical protein